MYFTPYFSFIKFVFLLKFSCVFLGVTYEYEKNLQYQKGSLDTIVNTKLSNI